MIMLRKLIIALSAAFLAFAPAHAQTGSAKTPAALNTEVNTLWADQTSGGITPFSARQTLLDIIASYAPIASCNISGSFPVFTGSWQCSTAPVSFAHLGATSDMYDFWIARPSAIAGTILQMQDGKGGNLRTLTSGTTGINFQSLVDTTSSGFTYSAISIDTQCQAGTSGSCAGINIVTQNNGTWIPGGGALPGAIAVEATGKSTRGGHVWGSDWTGWCLAIAAVECYGIEVNVRNDIAATAQASGIWIVNENSVVPTAGSGILISGQANNVGFPTALIYASTVAGFYPLTTAASFIKSDAATLVNGADFSLVTFTGAAWLSTGAKIDPSGNGIFNRVGAGTLTPSVPLDINTNANAASLSAPPAGTMTRFAGPDGGSPPLSIYDTFAGAWNFTMRRADGSAASRTGLVANDPIGNFAFQGWTSAGAYSGNSAVIRAVATETWSGTAIGSQIDFRTVPNTTTTIATAMSVFNSGGVGVGGAADPGIGKIAALTAFNVGSNQVVGARVTGYTAMTGTPDKATAFATSTVTLAQLAGRVMQMQADFTAHGLIGP